MHTHMHTHTHTYTRVCTHTYTHVHAHTYTYACTHRHIHIRTCMHTHTHVCVHTYIWTHACTETHTYIHVGAHRHTHTYTRVDEHTHTYTCAHTHRHTHTLWPISSLCSLLCPWALGAHGYGLWSSGSGTPRFWFMTAKLCPLSKSLPALNPVSSTPQRLLQEDLTRPDAQALLQTVTGLQHVLRRHGVGAGGSRQRGGNRSQRPLPSTWRVETGVTHLRDLREATAICHLGRQGNRLVQGLGGGHADSGLAASGHPLCLLPYPGPAL